MTTANAYDQTKAIMDEYQDWADFIGQVNGSELGSLFGNVIDLIESCVSIGRDESALAFATELKAMVLREKDTDFLLEDIEQSKGWKPNIEAVHKKLVETNKLDWMAR